MTHIHPGLQMVRGLFLTLNGTGTEKSILWTPMVRINVIENVFTDEQKRQMIEKVTDAMVSIEGEAMRGVTWVLVEEVQEGNWGIGGQGLTSADVRRLQEGVA